MAYLKPPTIVDRLADTIFQLITGETVEMTTKRDRNQPNLQASQQDFENAMVDSFVQNRYSMNNVKEQSMNLRENIARISRIQK